MIIKIKDEYWNEWEAEFASQEIKVLRGWLKTHQSHYIPCIGLNPKAASMIPLEYFSTFQCIKKDGSPRYIAAFYIEGGTDAF